MRFNTKRLKILMMFFLANFGNTLSLDNISYNLENLLETRPRLVHLDALPYHDLGVLSVGLASNPCGILLCSQEKQKLGTY